MIPGIPGILGLGTRVSDPFVYVAFWAPNMEALRLPHSASPPRRGRRQMTWPARGKPRLTYIIKGTFRWTHGGASCGAFRRLGESLFVGPFQDCLNIGIEPSEPPVMPQFLAFFEQAAVMPPRHANPEVASVDASILELPTSLPR